MCEFEVKYELGVVKEVKTKKVESSLEIIEKFIPNERLNFDKIRKLKQSIRAWIKDMINDPRHTQSFMLLVEKFGGTDKAKQNNLIIKNKELIKQSKSLNVSWLKHHSILKSRMEEAEVRRDKL